MGAPSAATLARVLLLSTVLAASAIPLITSPFPGAANTVSPPAGPSAGVPPGSPTVRPAVPADATPPTGSPRPAALIDPTEFYGHEPAPMGIADFGVTGAATGARGYSYTTPTLEGTTTISSEYVSIAGTSTAVTAFELNAVVVLQRGGTNYSYWIQNGLHFDGDSWEFSLGGAYVWNFSAPGAKLTAGELRGNNGSSLATDTYYYIPGCSAPYPLQCEDVALPVELDARIATGVSGGVPYVAYEYDAGTGWTTYDNVSFLDLTGATDAGFLVDGFTPTPYSNGLYYDAEWVWVGAGGGSELVDHGSDVNMSLAYSNGHNFQAVPTAWNFGSNTGETASNVTDVLAGPGAPVPAAHLTNGSGSLGIVYNLTQVGFVNVSVPTADAETLLIDGVAVPFEGTWANLTLDSGSHDVALEGYSNATTSFTIVARETTHVDLSGAGTVIFHESGLPPGTTWGVSVGTTSVNSTAAELDFHLPDGSFPVSYFGVPGFFRNGSAPTELTVPGATLIEVDFAVFTYAVPVTESGLPASTAWWIEANGQTVRSTSDSLDVPAPNGSTPFSVGTAYEFVADPGSGTIVVTRGVATPFEIVFSYRPTFIAGSVQPAGAHIAVAGVVEPVLGGAYNASVVPGMYMVTAGYDGYVSQSVNVTATPGNVTWANFTLAAVRTTPPPPTGGNGTPSGSAIPLGEAVAVVGGVAAVAAVAVALLVLRRRRSGGP